MQALRKLRKLYKYSVSNDDFVFSLLRQLAPIQIFRLISPHTFTVLTGMQCNLKQENERGSKLWPGLHWRFFALALAHFHVLFVHSK